MMDSGDEVEIMLIIIDERTKLTQQKDSDHVQIDIMCQVHENGDY